MKRLRLGLVSLFVGACSIPIAAAVVYASSIRGAGSSFVLDWLDAKGMVKPDPHAIPYASEPTIFSITDEKFVFILSAVAVVLALSAMATAIAAEYRRERTLYLSGGYIRGALALTLFRPLFGLVALIAGIAIVMVMRHGRGARDT